MVQASCRDHLVHSPMKRHFRKWHHHSLNTWEGPCIEQWHVKQHKHISPFPNPFSLQNLSLRNLTLPTCTLPLRWSLVFPLRFVVGLFHRCSPCWVTSTYQKRTRLIVMQMVGLVHLYVTFGYGLVTRPSLWTTFQFLSAYAEGKEQVSPSSEPQTVCDELQQLVISFLIQCRGEKK